MTIALPPLKLLLPPLQLLLPLQVPALLHHNDDARCAALHSLAPRSALGQLARMLKGNVLCPRSTHSKCVR